MFKQISLKFAVLLTTVITLQACAVSGDATATRDSAERTPLRTVLPPPMPLPGARPEPKTVPLGKTTNNPLGLIAQDFLQALLQVPGIASVKNQIGTRTMKSGFELAVVSGLQGQGYRLVTIDQTNNKNVIKTKTITNPQKKDEVTFILELNHLALKRTYEVRPNYVRPVSGLFVKGVSPNSITLDDRIFVQNFNI